MTPRPQFRFLHLIAFFVGCLSISLQAQDRNEPLLIIYPDKAFLTGGAAKTEQERHGLIIDITQPPYNAAGDGVSDDTKAFKSVLNDFRKLLAENDRKGIRYSIYLPKGVYLVSDSLLPDESLPKGFCNVKLIGESRQETTIRLKDNSSGFGQGSRKPVVATYHRGQPHVGGLMWGNRIRNLTIDTGKGNPGAVGLDYVSANSGSIDNVTIRSGDGKGFAGLWFSDWSQQGHFCDITVEGFEFGIRSDSVKETNPTLEYVTLRNQSVAGIHINRSAPCLRRIDYKGPGPGVQISGQGAHVVLLDSKIEKDPKSEGSPPAVELEDPDSQQLFIRNLETSGFVSAINQRSGSASFVEEWRSGSVFRHDSKSPDRTMNLPIREMPSLIRLPNVSDWVCPDDFPGENDGEKIQAALNSGKPGIYFPRFHYTSPEFALSIPSTVQQIDFMNSKSWIRGGMQIDTPSENHLYVENHTGRKLPLTINAARQLFARNNGMTLRITTKEPVLVHLANIAVLAGGETEQFCPPNTTIYARSINEEAQKHTNWLINGGTLWVMGFKTESDGTSFHAMNGAFVEVLGGYVNFAGPTDEQNPDVLNEESNVSYIGTNFMSRTHLKGIHEIRNGRLLTFPNEVFPRRKTGHRSNYFVPLYSGFDPIKVQERIKQMGKSP